MGHLIADQRPPRRIVSYRQKGDSSRSFDAIELLAVENRIELERATVPKFPEDEWVVFVGWQYRSGDIGDRRIVVHDSLLPRYRGFAPTATAMINGETEIGVTAFRPAQGLDDGAILGQKKMAVRYPAKIKSVYDEQASLISELIIDILHRSADGPLEGAPQRSEDATYSIWRDQYDYCLDWNCSADEICRTIDAVGFPFSGAQTTLNGETIVVDDAHAVADIPFERRDVGKVWELAPGGPIVVCGTGCVQVTGMRDRSGNRVDLSSLRSRFS